MKIGLSAAGKELTFETDSLNVIEFWKSNTPCAFLPEFACIKDTNSNRVFSYEDGPMRNLLATPERIEYTGLLGEDVTMWDILFLASMFFERQYQEDCKYTLHSSAFSKGEKGILVAGDRGCGKTVLCLEASLHNDFSYGSNERTLINPGSGSIVSGTNCIHVNQFHQKQFLLPNSDCIPYSELGLSKMSNVGLSMIVFPKIADSRSVCIRDISMYNVRDYIYRDMSTLINGLFLVDRMNCPAPSFDTTSLKEQRADAAVSLSNKVPAYFIEGNRKQIIEAIGKLI